MAVEKQASRLFLSNVSGKAELGRMLGRYRQVDEEILSWKTELRLCKEQEAEIASASLSSPLTGMPRAKGGVADPTLRAVEKIIDQCQERAHNILARIQALMAERAQVDKLLEELDPIEQRIVRMRLIQRKGWIPISVTIRLCERQCQRICQKAVEKMAARMEECPVILVSDKK